LCNAQALRELQAVIDAAPPGQWCRAAQAADAQRDTKDLVDASLTIDGTLSHVDRAKLAAAHHRYHSAVLIGKRETAARAGPLMRKHHALARRLLDREDDYLRYTRHPRVPFDNEGASYCTSWVRSAVLRFSRWSARCVNSVAWGTDILGQWAAEAGVVAAS